MTHFESVESVSKLSLLCVNLKLKLGFQDIPNTYRLRSARPFHIDPQWKSTVKFTTPDPAKLPVPSPAYLELHAACCRIADLSGAGEYIETILRDMEDIQVLSQDGTSAEVLQYALEPLLQLRGLAYYEGFGFF